MDVLEHEPRGAPSPLSVLSLACVLTTGAGVVAVARHEPPPPLPAAAAAATTTAAGEPWSGPRRVPAALLPPGRPRRNSPTQIGPAPPPEVPRLGTVAAGSRPGRAEAHRAAFAMAVRLCRDPSLIRLRVLQRDDDWSAVTWYARVYEDPPSYGGFAMAMRWNGTAYAYTVTGKAGDCRDLGRG